MAPDRTRVLATLRAQLDQELATLARMTEMARDEATSAESRPENQYDTRALEASYLAAGQGQRLADLERLIAWVESQHGRTYEQVQAGAIVGLSDGGWLLMAPRGGIAVRVDGVEVRLVSAVSPLGESLCGLSEGDDADDESGRAVVAVR
jgi:transcription elongation GreA/GreB family factor